MRTIFIGTIFFLLHFGLVAQSGRFLQPSDSLHSGRLRAVVITEAALYTGTMLALNELWYSDYDRSSFHFFNDNAEWRQMDKLGHAVTGYYVGVLGMDALRWAGVDACTERSRNERRSRWYGGGLGWFFLTSFEFLDGTSEEWGFSTGDMIANTIGAGLAIGQDALWHEQRITMKWSSRPTDYADLRPEVLGSNWKERIIKDYNGQTYWATFNLATLVANEKSIPKWLGLSVGYGVDGMIDGRDRAVQVGEDINLSLKGNRQFFISLDADLWRIQTKRTWLKAILKGVGFIKIPAPTVEFTKDQTAIHWLYF